MVMEGGKNVNVTLGEKAMKNGKEFAKMIQATKGNILLSLSIPSSTEKVPITVNKSRLIRWAERMGDNVVKLTIEDNDDGSHNLVSA